ncbi:hypothetical protein AsACE_CH02207 [Acinetobacter schindleri]|nr:hypothetical protein AsACE_CH02207 [Acinetobacter schindleri]
MHVMEAKIFIKCFFAVSRMLSSMRSVHHVYKHAHLTNHDLLLKIHCYNSLYSA